MTSQTAPLVTARGALHYQWEGQGPWVVLCHALGTDASLWSAAVQALQPSFRVATFDLRGHGQSPPPPDGDYSFDAMAQDIVEILDHLKAERASLVGISVGGEVAQVFAAAHAERVRNLVLCSTACVTEPARAQIWQRRIQEVETRGMTALARASVERWFTPRFFAAHPEMMERFRRRLAAMEPRVYIGIARAIQRMDLRPVIRRLRCRTLVLCGDQDANTGPQSANVIMANMPNSELWVFEETAHFPNLEAPERFNSLLREWLLAP